MHWIPRVLVVFGFALLTSCGGLPFVGGPSSDERRAPCDRMAAEAIQTKDIGEARRLAASAAACYGRLQS